MNYVAQLQATFDARDQREAEELGISVDELHRRQEAEDRVKREAERQAEASRRRASRLDPALPVLTPTAARAICRGELDETSALAAVRRWLDDVDGKAVLVLTGDTGTGKTVAAAWAIAEHGGQYVRSVQLAERHTPYSGDVARGIEPLNPASGMLLVLDDVGTERRNAQGARDPRWMPAWLDVIDQRQGAMRRGATWIARRTLVTTNLSRDAFVREYAADERVASRLAQSAEIVGCGGRDMRRGGAK